ncbi:hypothetical protein NKI74_33130 [Mesorhizobium sp. M0494]|uniref:hypothetical protein n=1 Tax=Mesorhizobium sp. M0494 TaxID=2956951 RepID=UPI003338D244
MAKIFWWGVIVGAFLLIAQRSLFPDELFRIPIREILDNIWIGALIPLVAFVDRHFDNLVSWPVAAVLTAFILVRSELVHSLFLSTASRVKSLDLFGFSVELTEQIKELRRESDDLFRILPAVQESVAKELKARVTQANIEPAFSRLVCHVSKEIKRLKADFQPHRCRATIHVEGVLFSGQLMQLLEYVSGEGVLLPGRRAGRTFSIRRGIVGRVWRSHISEVRGVLPTDAVSANADERRRHIAQIWGLTEEEARHVERYPSYISVPFLYGKSKTAVFYMDSTLEQAFPEEAADQLSTFIKSATSEEQIDSALGDLDSLMDLRNTKAEALESIGER